MNDSSNSNLCKPHSADCQYKPRIHELMRVDPRTDPPAYSKKAVTREPGKNAALPPFLLSNEPVASRVGDGPPRVVHHPGCLEEIELTGSLKSRHAATSVFGERCV
ncbi:uncharacterized protein DNG_02825 [Cephalotrichum gorgonifer]|uniref:Uncharacterized protein n=1 Tax=Cephalotrichum gorgonifer TaxID=2041049 RepID=A0AAE8MU84_9PEZI|nr:uncharacterized protein DNG_02825 [Cephalotrichum gorgonifer]